jgi:hypothetical protein
MQSKMFNMIMYFFMFFILVAQLIMSSIVTRSQSGKNITCEDAIEVIKDLQDINFAALEAQAKGEA